MVVYKEIERLNVIETESILEEVSAKYILNAIKYLNFNVYFRCNGIIYGAINIKDIKSIEDNIKINNDFKRIYERDFYEIRKLFEENRNQELPVFNQDDLVGAYVYGSDIIEIKAVYDYIDMNWIINTYGENIIFLNIEDYANKKFVRDYFEACGFNCIYKTLQELMNEPSIAFPVVCSLESETEVWHHIRAEILNYGYFFDANHSLKTLYNSYDYYCNNMNSDVIEQYFYKMRSKGVNIFTLTFDYKNDNVNKLLDGIKDKYAKHNLALCEKILEPTIFFDDLYSNEYEDKIVNIPLVMKNICGRNMLSNFESELFNVKDNKRSTIGIRNLAKKTIHFFGPCLIIGRYVDDAHTIESYIQKYINQDCYNITVVNHGAWNNSYYQLQLISEADIKSGDIVIVFDKNMKFNGIPNIDLTDTLYNVKPEWFVDNIYHPNHIVNEKYAKKIYSEITPFLNGESIEIKKEWIDEGYIANKYITRYFSKFDTTKHGTIGSIVMNANPFTLGHMYLVEESLKIVDYLIIFVVSEDRAVFTQTERLALVKEAVKKYDNVFVVPSGDIIASNRTFPNYFLKIVDDNLEESIKYDLSVFSEYIAPGLNMKYRFIGSEPIDEVTSKYNTIMHEILPKNNIKVYEIDRRKHDNNIVSASTVRDILKNHNYKELKKYLPITTYNYLRKYIDGFEWYPKSYFIFVIDDCNSFTPECYNIFHEHHVPLGIACITDYLDVVYREFDSQNSKSIRDTLHLVEMDRGEVLVHYYGNLADLGYSDDEHKFLTSDTEWYEKIVESKKILENEGYKIRGVIRADYTQKNSKKGQEICEKYFEYSDNIGITDRYSLGNRKCFFDKDMQSMTQVKEHIDECCKNPGVYSFCLHGSNKLEPLANRKDLGEIIEYIKQHDTAEITTYSAIFDKYFGGKE